MQTSVYCMFEFPGPEYSETFDVGYYDKVENYPPSVLNKQTRQWDRAAPLPGYETDPNKKVVVTYSSINGNGFGGWGEVVMGSKGTLVLDKETDVLLYRNSDTSSKVGVAKQDGGYVLDTSASGDYAAPVAKAADSGPVSRGYREEIEHWAYCIRNPDKENHPRCTRRQWWQSSFGTNVEESGSRGGYLQFKEEWFDINDATGMGVTSDRNWKG